MIPVAWLADAAQQVQSLVLAECCAGCQQPGRLWCSSCAESGGGPVMRSSVSLGGNGTDVPVFSAAEHASAAGRAVVHFKEAGARGLARPLATMLARSVAAAVLDARGTGGPVDLVVIPSRPASLRSRGRDPLGELARGCARQLRGTGLDVAVCSVLVHDRQSRDQLGLTGLQRRRNMAGVLRARGRTRAGLVVVVDDVLTTGATISAGLRALAAGPPATRVSARRLAAATITTSQSRVPRAFPRCGH